MEKEICKDCKFYEVDRKFVFGGKCSNCSGVSKPGYTATSLDNHCDNYKPKQIDKKMCSHKWNDVAVINYPPETSVICNKCGKELIKTMFKKIG